MESAISKARSLAARTVHIKISPSARNFRESREVLLELEEKCGEYHPTSPVQNAALAVFQTEAAAHKALNLTPFTYGVITSQVQSIKAYVGPPGGPMPFEEGPAASESPETTAKDQKSNKTAEAEANAEVETPKREEKWFQLDVSPSDFVHEKYIKSTVTNPLYGSYLPVGPSTSFLAGTLKQTVLPSMWAKGLRDWETDAVKRKEEVGVNTVEERGFASGNTRAKASSPRILSNAVEARFQKRQERTRPRVMNGLRALREERKRMEAEAVIKETG